MTDLGSKSKLAARARPTLSHVSAAGGTAKVRGKSAFVSPVSLVSPYSRLLEDYRKEDQERQRRAVIALTPRLLGQVGQAQQPRGFKVRH